MGNVNATQILVNHITVSSSRRFRMSNPNSTFHVRGITSAGAGAATIEIEATNQEPTLDATGLPSVPTEWVNLGQITLVLSTTVASDGFAVDAGWKYIRADVTVLTGTDATLQGFIAADTD